MKLTAERRRETGAFYTPKIWAEKALEYIEQVVPSLEDFIFYDPCCGEGALLEVLPEGVEKYGSTLEWGDVEICREKGFQVWQHDFLKEYWSETDIRCILSEEKRKRLIVFTNPPYVKLSKAHDSYAKMRYKTNDSVALFYYRILQEYQPLMLAGFNKLDIYQSTTLRRFREDIDLLARTVKVFVSPSSSWELKGNFPIAFNIIV